MIRHLLAFFLISVTCFAQVTLHPSDNVPKIVNSKPAGTTFIFTAGTYRLSESITPKDNDKFIGEQSCAPPSSPCPAILTGGVEIGSLASQEAGNYAVAKQKQKGARGNPKVCEEGWEGCYYPEDVFFDGTPLKHIEGQSLPSLSAGEWWFDYNNHTIYFHDDPSGHTVETSVLNTAFAGSANNITIQYLTIKEFANMYPTGAVGDAHGKDVLTQGINWKVQNCELTLNHGFAVRVNYGIQILHNYIHDNGQVGIGGGIGDPSINARVLIMGNTINHNDYAHFNPGFGSGGFKVGSTAGVTLRGNIIQHNEGSGIHFDIDGQNELVDGNVITDNSDADGLQQEIGFGPVTFRNNIVLRNGEKLNGHGPNYQISVRASSGTDIYCNVLEIPPGQGVGGWSIGSSNRGNSTYPPFRYRATFGNSFHHNTIIWEPGAEGEVGFRHNDPGNQPDFFAKNAVPDFNTYHVSSKSGTYFLYDNDNSKSNHRKSFSEHQRSHAEMHGSVDTNNRSGFPEVSIQSPADQSTVSGPVTVSATASDKSGIRKVEFYVDWALQGTVNSAPYDFNWANGTSGSHIVAAMAYSNAGIRNCYAVTLNQQ